MYVGDVGWFLRLATELYDVHVCIFDCTREDVVWDSDNYPDEDIALEVEFAGLGDYEVCSYDLYTDKNGKICLELNIDMDEEEE